MTIRKSFDDLITAWTVTLERADAREILVAHSVPNGWIYRAPEMLADPRFTAHDAIVRVSHPDLGEEYAMQNVAPRLSATPGSDPLGWPRTGRAQRRDLGRGAGPERR